MEQTPCATCTSELQSSYARRGRETRKTRTLFHVHTICGWSRQNPAGHLQQHTNMQAPTTAACIKQKNRGRTSKVNAHNHKPAALHHLAGPVFNATAPKQPIVSVPHHRQAAHPNSSSKAHEILLTKTIMHVKTTRVHELELLQYGASLSSSIHSSSSIHPQAHLCKPPHTCYSCSQAAPSIDSPVKHPCPAKIRRC